MYLNYIKPAAPLLRRRARPVRVRHRRSLDRKRTPDIGAKVTEWLAEAKPSEGVFGWAVAVEKAAVGCELWKSCCGLWAVENLKAVWLNKYKTYLLFLSLLKQLWKSFLFHPFWKAESQKPKAGSKQLSKMYYGKAAASEKITSRNNPLVGLLAFGAKSRSQKPNQTQPKKYNPFCLVAPATRSAPTASSPIVTTASSRSHMRFSAGGTLFLYL